MSLIKDDDIYHDRQIYYTTCYQACLEIVHVRGLLPVTYWYSNQEYNLAVLWCTRGDQVDPESENVYKIHPDITK